MKKLLLSLFLASLSACATLSPTPPPLPVTQGLNLDRELMQPCQTPTPLASGKEEDVVSWGLDLQSKLFSCSKNHEALVNALKTIK